jgi:hypothetical protein
VISLTSVFIAWTRGGMIVGFMSARLASSAATGPTAATTVFERPSHKASSSPRARATLRAPQPLDLGGAGQGEDIDAAGGDPFDQVGDPLAVGFAGVDIGRDRIGGGSRVAKELH